MRKLLIVSPHFPPINAPDHQRVRMALPYLAECGWQAHVLAVAPEGVEGVRDPLLLQTLPPDVPVTYTRSLPVNYTRLIGLGNIGWRSWPYLAAAGRQLLARESFDLAYFSTTVFLAMTLSSRWKQQFKLPYVLDFQDPWLSDYYRQPGAGKPPGGRLKYGFSQLVARWGEPRALRHVSHITSVSPAYPKMLCQRYDWLREEQFSVLPFGAPERDFQLLSQLEIEQTIFDPNDGLKHWVYVGAIAQGMTLALRGLFAAIRQHRAITPDIWQRVRLHFVGTSYAPSDRAQPTVEPLAREYGVADLVSEQPQRLPYFQALQVLADSSAILAIGSDDSGYSASKLYPCILARKPILAIFHQQSLVVDILHRTRAGQIATFTGDTAPDAIAIALQTHLDWLLQRPQGEPPETDWTAFAPYTARQMTAKLGGIFETAIASVPTAENSSRR